MDQDSGTNTAPAKPAHVAQADGDFRRGSLIDRYVVLDKLGAGGMGVVFKAYDPDLDRRVAIKLLLRRDADPDRLLREGQAIAKLSHANVVAVHDVGVTGDDFYIVMEYVPGETLGHWLTESRSRDEVLDVFMQAGRGLAAGHAKGIVHRDFKPSNVLVGDDGVTRVLDFGLATASGAPVTEPDADELARGDTLLDESLTKTGSIVGTPKYMAPEQFTDERVDARADQFAFCAALYEAVVGQSPFEDIELARLTSQRGRRDVRPIQSSADVPRWLEQLIRRGLSVAAAERFDSMVDLLGELSRDRRATRKRIIAIGGVAALAGIAVASFALRSQGGGVDPCAATADAVKSVWTSEDKQGVRAALTTSGVSDVDDVFAGVDTELTKYLRDWEVMRVDACEATHKRGEQSDLLFERRVACLDRRLQEARGLIGLLSAELDEKTAGRASDAAGSLASLKGCADAEALLSKTPPPEDPVVRARVEELQSELDKAYTLRSLAKYDEAMALGKDLLERAPELEYPPLEVDIHGLLSGLYNSAGDTEGAERATYAMIELAAKAKDDVGQADAWAALLWVIGNERAGRHQEAIKLIPAAEAAAFRAGDDKALAKMWNNSGIVHDIAGNREEAMRRYEKALELRERLYGPESAEVARILGNMAIVAAVRGDVEQAIELEKRALAIQKKTMGENHPDVGRAHFSLALSYVRARRFDEADAEFEQTRTVLTAAQGDHRFLLTLIESVKAETLLSQERYEEAKAQARKAMGLLEPLVGKEHRTYSSAMVTLAKALSANGEYREADVVFAEAVRIAAVANGDDSHDLVEPLGQYAQMWLWAGKPKRAIPLAERALRVWNDGSPEYRAFVEFVLAQALRDAGVERKRAVTLAKAAREGYAGAGETEQVAEIDAWLAKND